MKVREGILLKNVCDAWLLIAVGEAGKYCRYVREVNDTFAWYFSGIQKGKEKEEIIKDTLERFDVSEELARKDLDKLIEELYSMNYLLREEE